MAEKDPYNKIQDGDMPTFALRPIQLYIFGDGSQKAVYEAILPFDKNRPIPKIVRLQENQQLFKKRPNICVEKVKGALYETRIYSLIEIQPKLRTLRYPINRN